MLDVNELQRILLGREVVLSIVVLDGKTPQSTPTSGHRADYDGAKKRQGSEGAYRRRYAGPTAECGHHLGQ
jgi:hypothetical protein